MLFKGFEAYVEVLESSNPDVWTRLPEYKPVQGARTTECYVESKEGTRFRMAWRDVRPGRERKDVSGWTCVDGTVIRRTVSRKDSPQLHIKEGRRIGAREELPFIFDKKKTTDNDMEVNVNEQQVREIGSLQVKIHRGVAEAGRRFNPYRHYKQGPVAPIFSEQDKKASLTHNVAFGPAIKVDTHTHAHLRYTDSKDNPYLTFTFKYRSGDSLEFEGIRPASTAPTAATQQRPASSSTQVLAAARVPSRSIPHQISDNEVEPAVPKIKSEHPRVKKEKTSFNHAAKRTSGVIDIDDSDDEESELVRLRKEVESLRKKVKREPGTAKGEVIDLSD